MAEVTTPLITWCVIVAAMVILVIVKSSIKFYNLKARHHLIEIGSEREELFVPGDVTYNSSDRYGDNDD